MSMLLAASVLLAPLALLSGCAAPAPRADVADATPAPGPVVFDAAFYRAPPRDGRVYELDAATSRVEVLVFREGPLARQGHNHVISAAAFEGAVFVPDAGLAGARLDLVFDPAGFTLDDPARRAAHGPAFEGALSQRARAGTRANMLGSDVLDQARHPRIGVRSIAVQGELPTLSIEVELTLAGVARALLVPVHVAIEGGQLRARGSLALRPSAHGIAPFRALGGMLRVADAVVIEFELVGRAPR